MPIATTSKRSRRAALGEDDNSHADSVTYTHASSSLRNGSERKRARLSDSGPSASKRDHSRRAQSPSDDGSEDQTMQDPDNEPAPPPATQFESLRDAGHEHLRNTDQDDQRATQRLTARPNIVGDNHEAMNGIIQTIECINFMCHERLLVELGPLLNFIVGENGSGKSATLSAITLCLGGKASATNRGGSLRSFVKEGQEHSTLIVKIKNQGDDAYKNDVFGDSIVVERHFTKSGSSGFKLKSESGRIISTKKSDVDDVVEYYCLQVDNPLNVLSQDNARQFLNAATASQKYRYFTLGTQLEQLSNDYQLILEYLEASEEQLNRFEGDIAILKQEAEKAVKLKDALLKTSEMKQKQKLYMYQLAWAQVKEQEDILSDKESKVEAAQRDIELTGRKIEEETERLEALDKLIADAQQAAADVRQAQEHIVEAEVESRGAYSTSKAELQQLHTQERELHTQLSKAKRMVDQHKAAIQQEEQRLEQANSGATLAAQTEKTIAEEAHKDALAAQQEHEDQLPELKRQVAEAEQKSQEASNDVEPKRRAVVAAETNLRSLENKRTDPFAAFHPGIKQLIKVIANDKQFSSTPIGPLGPTIQVLKPKWAPVIENLCGQSLNSFLVESKSDQVRLKSHMDRLGLRDVPIIIAKTKLSALNEPDPEFETALRILKFDDERVRDVLVINHRIEQCLLVDTRVEAERIMFDGNPPRYSAFCMTFHDTRREIGLTLRSRNGNLSTSPFQLRYDQKPRIRSDEELDVRFHQSRIEQLREELREAEVTKTRLRGVAQRCSTAIVQHKKHANVLAKAVADAIDRKGKAEDALDALSGAQNKLNAYQEHLKNAEDECETYGNQYGNIHLQRQDLNKKVESLKQQHDEAKMAVADSNAKVAKFEKKVSNLENSRYSVVIEKNGAHESHDLAKVTKNSAEASRDRQVAHVEDMTRQAKEVCPTRVDPRDGETYAQIEKKYESLTEQLKKVRAQLGASDEEINNRATQKLTQYRETKAGYRNNRALVDSVKQSLMDRLDRWRTFQRLISAQARANFQYLLSERGFRGRLLLDHQQKKLELQVEPDQTRKAGDGRNTKTLSGGEKSFSSICMLLAIWDAMGSPLRCLDEFDVFMDNVNRRVSTDMLITTARRSVGKQFILITPNAIEGRTGELGNDVKIIRMTDPRQRRMDDYTNTS